MSATKPNSTKEKLLKLMDERTKLESKISECGAVLEANQNVGMNGPLVDIEGYPRNDIDVFRVRQVRQQIICFQNDHKDLMKKIEELLHKLHAEEKDTQNDVFQEASGMQTNEPESNSSAPTDEENLKVFAKLNLISPGSPAELAGLATNDEILQFGTINSNNFSNLNQIAEVVRHMQNQRVNLKVQRNGKVLDLILIPKTWNGRGLLGCNIVLP